MSCRMLPSKPSQKDEPLAIRNLKTDVSDICSLAIELLGSPNVSLSTRLLVCGLIQKML